MIRHAQCRGHQRGALAVEAALILPSLLMIAAVATGGWRLSEVRADAQSAAEVAARAGSVASTVGEGHAVGQRVAMVELAGTRCSDPAITIDSSALAVPVGSTGLISARVRCTVRLADLLVPGMPGALHVESRAHSTVDSHRERHA
ncbi:TadE/TadG family type IV pilus assembly protein [Cutibacterium sp. V947]|uniref:TadE/TadG family type IV pilus assembly protein n=1 Tax=Cutibacterium sp. V947 TaxID=3446480 RepID=UPI003EDF69CE